MQSTSRLGQLAAWAILALLILVPATVLLTVRRTSPAWLIWTVASLWTGLNAVQLTTQAFPEHHSPQRALGVTLLAVVNVALSLGLALLPRDWISSLH